MRQPEVPRHDRGHPEVEVAPRARAAAPQAVARAGRDPSVGAAQGAGASREPQVGMTEPAAVSGAPPASLRLLLRGVVDYAGLFPPAGLTMADAVAAYARHREEDASWMLGRFVLPAARLDEF